MMSQPTSFDNTCLSILSDVTIVIPSYCRQPFCVDSLIIGVLFLAKLLFLTDL